MQDLPAWLDRRAWPYTPHWQPLRDGRVHFVEEGKGPSLVLVHGTPTWSFDWRHVIAAMRDSHRVVAMDHLGFGLSERPPGASYTPEAHAGRFKEFMAQVCPQEDLALVVHDFGGPIALDWALENAARLRHLVIVNTWMWSFDIDPVMKRRAAMVDNAFGRWMYRRLNASLKLVMPSAFADRSRLTKELHAQYLSVFPDPDSRELVLFALAHALRGSSAFYASLWERRDRLRQTPMSILWGMKDSAFQPPILERWEREFPHAKVTRFPDAGHWPHEESPEPFLSALKQAVG